MLDVCLSANIVVTIENGKEYFETLLTAPMLRSCKEIYAYMHRCTPGVFEFNKSIFFQFVRFLTHTKVENHEAK